MFVQEKTITNLSLFVMFCLQTGQTDPMEIFFGFAMISERRTFTSSSFFRNSSSIEWTRAMCLAKF